MLSYMKVRCRSGYESCAEIICRCSSIIVLKYIYYIHVVLLSYQAKGPSSVYLLRRSVFNVSGRGKENVFR